MNKLECITAFIAVVEKKSFAGAAKKCGISTAAISKKITRLEFELKTKLLNRTTRKISLTEIGDQYYQHCKKLIQELIDAESDIMQNQSEVSGILNITSNRYFAMRYLLPKLSQFMALYPKLLIRVELAERIPNLDKEEVDIIFGVSAGGPDKLVRKRIANTRYVLCASPKYLEVNGTPKTPADLKQHRYITHMMRMPDNVVKFKGNKEIVVKPILYLNDSRAMRECAIQNMGIVMLHDYVVVHALQDGRLVEFLSEYHEAQQPIYLYYQQSRYLQPKIRKFIDFFTA